MLSKKTVEKSLTSQLEERRREIGKLEKDLQFIRSLRSARDMEITVTIRSLWKDEGEKDVIYRAKGGLEETMKAAIAQFKAENNRSDVQGSYHVRVLLPNGSHVAVGEEHYKEFEDRR